MPPLPAPVFVGNGGVYTQAISELPVGNNGYTHPADNPTPPGDAFNPTVSTNAPAAGAPAVTTFTPQAGNDCTVLMQGGAFTTYSGNDSGKDARLWSTDANGLVYQPQILRVTSQALAVLMSPPSGTYGMYLTWAENANGVGYPVRVNGTDAWWVGPNHALAGSSINVYGRNLCYQNGTNSSWVFIRPWSSGPATASTPCAVTQVNPYKVTFTVPAGLSAGDYEVWSHNGHGGVYGWSGPLKFTVDSTPPYQWNGVVHNVKSPPYNALGDGVSDDTTAIQSAINACSPGDIVFLPAGTFLISSRLNAGHISVEGAGAGSTTIQTYNQAFNDLGMLYFWYNEHNRVRNLTLSCTATNATSFQGMIFADDYGAPVFEAGFVVESCNFITPQNAWNTAIVMSTMKDVWITNNTFTTSGIGVRIADCRQAYVNGNTFYGNASNNSPTAFGNSTSQEADYSGNTAATLNRANNQVVNRLFTTGANGGTVFNIYFGDNSCSSCGPLATETEQNSGEMILWENQNVQYTGSPSAVGPATLTYGSANWSTNQFTWPTTGRPTGVMLYVDNGPGLGTWRRIISNSSNTITVDHAWDMPPTTTSHTVLVQGGARTVTYHNRLDGVPDYATRIIAGSGVQPGVSFDTVIANNIITHSRGGIAFGANVQPTNQQDRLAVANLCNNLVVNNSISNSLAGISCSASVWTSGSGATVFGSLLLNNVFRDNLLVNIDNTGLSIDMGYATWNWPWQQHNLFEQNAGINCSRSAMQVGAQQAYTIIRRNSFSRNDSYLAPGFNFSSQSLSPFLYENSFDAQVTPFVGTLPGPGQNLGTRRFDFSASIGGPSPASQTATLWNIGTSTLNVSASSDQSWLSANFSSPSITTGATATVTVKVDPSGLNLGNYTGTVTVAGGSYSTPETLFATLTINAAPIVLTSIGRSGNDINLAWSTTGGTTNAVQFATAGGLSTSNGFAPLSGNIVISGNGSQTTNYTHFGAATNWPAVYYRVLQVP